MDLKEAIKILKRRGYTQKDLGDFLGYTQGMISLLFSEKTNSSRRNEIRNKIIVLAEVYVDINRKMNRKIKGMLRRLNDEL